MTTDELAGEKFWEGVRARYPQQQPLLNLNNASVSPPPLVVEQATIEAYRLISRNPDVNMWSKLDAALPAVKQQRTIRERQAAAIQARSCRQTLPMTRRPAARSAPSPRPAG